MKRIYFDYAATTPVDPRVLRAMEPYFTEKFGNPGSLHAFGQEAMAALDESRETVAKAIGAQFREIIFTGSATEANNLALRGALRSVKCQVSGVRKPRIIVSAIEHESILETARDVRQEGAEVVYLPVNRAGVVDVKKLEAALNERTVLVSVQYVNNEIGAVQPISEIGALVAHFREQRIRDEARRANRSSRRANGRGQGARGREQRVDHLPFAIYHLPLFHTDAAQAFQYYDCDAQKLGADLMTLSSHKIYGPKGIGALYVRGQRAKSREQIANSRGQRADHLPFAISPLPMMTGGGQEFGLRSGTESVPQIAGFARAATLLGNSEKKRMEAERIRKLRGYFWNRFKTICPDAEENSEAESASPHIVNIHTPRREAQDTITALDLSGVAIASGSACRSRSLEPSYVLEALGYSRERAKKSVRISFGRPTTIAEIDKAIRIMQRLFR